MAIDLNVVACGAWDAFNLLSVTSRPASHAPSAAWPWIISTAIIVFGLVVLGWSDLVRTHWARIWAISSVCQTESLRKRVLWVAPLAIVGVMVVSAFQQPSDPQAAIQQVTKFCLFTSAMLVTITAVILACTSIPREIENRVIFTIVTKPTTRLEIVLGKVVGFARVSGLIILIMGVFTLAYLELRTRPIIEDLKTQIVTLGPDNPNLATNRYYIDSGLLSTRSLEGSNDLQFFARPPGYGSERWMNGGVGQYCMVPFDLSAKDIAFLSAAVQAGAPVDVRITANVDRSTPTGDEHKQAEEMGLIDHKIKANETLGPSVATTAPTTMQSETLIPQMGVRLLDSGLRPLSGISDSKDAGMQITIAPMPRDPSFSGEVRLDTETLTKLISHGRFYIQINGRTPATEFGVNSHPVSLVFPWPVTRKDGKFIRPDSEQATDGSPDTIGYLPPIESARDATNPSRYALPGFFAYPSRHGMRLTPLADPANFPTKGPVAVFGFHNTVIEPNSKGKVGLQINAYIERLADFNLDVSHQNGYSDGSVEVVNSDTHESSGLIKFQPEVSQIKPVEVDARYFKGGNFNVILRNTTRSQTLGVEAGVKSSIAVVVADRSFVFNLFKSLFILWLMAILVVIIAVFSSTFLSWPIAIVLTLLILLGHWGVEQLGDSLNPGASGRGVVGTFQIRDPDVSVVFETAVEDLSSLLRNFAKVLPDVSKFAVTEDIERGVSIPFSKIKDSLAVLYCYGLPMLVLSYVIMKRKEVAP